MLKNNNTCLIHERFIYIIFYYYIFLRNIKLFIVFFKNIITASIIRRVFGSHLAAVEDVMINDNTSIMNTFLVYYPN